MFSVIQSKNTAKKEIRNADFVVFESQKDNKNTATMNPHQGRNSPIKNAVIIMSIKCKIISFLLKPVVDELSSRSCLDIDLYY